MNERPRWHLLDDGEDPPAGRSARDLGDGRRELPDRDDDDPDDCPAIVVTFFADYAAATKREQALDLTDLAHRIEVTTGPDKAHLPWLKCARFGDIRTDKASLRWDGNLLAITGIEGDYDGEQVSFEAAQDKLGAAGILAILYTSPSHTEDTPRWRVLCPLSQEYPPDRRDAFLARVNGLFSGIFSRESWTRSQSYYFGSVNSNPSHRVVVLAGKPIDQAVELDTIAIGKPVKPEATTRPAYPAADPSRITDKRVNGKIESLLENIRNAADGAKHFTLWDNALAIGGYLSLTDWTDEQAVERCIAALPSAKDWNLARRTAAEAIANGRLKPLQLEERPLPPHGTGRTGNGGVPPELERPKPEDTDTKPEGETAEAADGQAPAPPAPEPEGETEPYGPPTLADLDIAALAALDEIAFARIVKAKATLLGVDVPALTKRVQRARSEAKAKTKTEEREARAKAKAEAKAKPPPPLTAAEIEAEIERLAKLSKGDFYAERDTAAWRLRMSSSELTSEVRAAKARYARENNLIPPFVTEQDVLRAFVTQFSDDLRFNHSNGSWLVWAEHFWQPDQRKLAFYWSLDLCKQMAPSASDDGRAVVEKVRFSAAVETGARVMPDVSSTQEDWDHDPWLLGTPGGVVDLKTGILRPGKRGDMITTTTAVTPAATEDCPLWLKFLAEATGGDTGMVGFLKRHFGYCLTGLTMEEIIVFLFGPGGAGKGTVVKTVTGILDDYALTAPIELFTAQGFRPSEYYRAKMASKRLMVAAETERGAFWAEAFVKEISGGDRLSGRHPAGRPFDFDPTHKPLLHGNHMPKLRGPSTAMERRLRIAPFTHKPANPDPELKDKLRPEWPGILRWMINGCLEWQRDGLQPPASMLAANKNYFDAQDALGRWIEDSCILDQNKRLPPTLLRTSYNNWAKANGEDEMDGAAFAEAVEQFEGARLTRGRSGAQRWIKGLDLQPKPTGRPWWMDHNGDPDDRDE